MCHSSSVNLHRGPLSRVAWIRIVLSLRKRRSVWESSFGVCPCLATLATSWNQSSVTPSSVSCLLLMQRAAVIVSLIRIPLLLLPQNEKFSKDWNVASWCGFINDPAFVFFMVDACNSLLIDVQTSNWRL